MFGINQYAAMGMACSSLNAAYNQQMAAQQANFAQQMAAQQANFAQASMWNQQHMNYPQTQAISRSRPCPYCGRTSHKAGYTSCDGCGASL